MTLDPGRLRVLVEVAHAGSLAAAARHMSFTPSALSQQLTKLERELGCRLVDRTPGGIRMTAIGQVLLEHGERVLGELREAEAVVRAAVEAEPYRLSVGTFATAAMALLPEALAALRQRYPAVELSLVDIEPPAGYGLVVSRDLDLLITHRYPGVPSVPVGALQRRRLLGDPLRLVLPSGHPQAGVRECGGVRPAALADEEWISGAHGVPSRVCLEVLAADAGFRPHVSYETSDYQATLALIGAGLGIALVPASILDNADLTHLAVRELHGVRPIREVCAVHRKRPPKLVGELVALLGH